MRSRVSPEAMARMTAKANERWADPAAREEVRAKMIALWKDPEYRAWFTRTRTGKPINLSPEHIEASRAKMVALNASPMAAQWREHRRERRAAWAVERRGGLPPVHSLPMPAFTYYKKLRRCLGVEFKEALRLAWDFAREKAEAA